MRLRFRMSFYCVFVISVISSTSASAHIYPDTTIQIAGITKKASATFVTSVKTANVVYPAVLQDHREQTWEYIEKFCNQKRDYLIHVYQTGKKYFPKIADILKRYKLPEELRVLIALESNFNANAISRGGAVGYWQIMAAVAKEYGLQTCMHNSTTTKRTGKDDRLSLNKSTIFAAKYLSDQRLNFNADLLLMVASYNCGLGKVRSAIRRSGKKSPGFWDIKKLLPVETRNYVLNFIALNVIFENYQKFLDRELIFSAPVDTEAARLPAFDDSIQSEPAIVD